MDAVSRYERLKRQVEQTRSEQDRRQGSLDGLLKRLKEEHGLKTEAACEKEIAKQEALADRLEAEADEDMDEAEGML